MLQTSITEWLSKPSAVTQPDAVPLKPQQAKRPDSDNFENDSPATPPPGTVATAVSAAAKAPQSLPSTTIQNATTTSDNSTAPTAPAPPTTLPALSPNITLAPLTASSLPSFRRLNTLLLEIPYPAKFYDEILTDPVTASITLAAFWRNTPSSTTTPTSNSNNNNPPGILVAGIRCRLLSASALALPPALLEDHHHQPPRPYLYIATLSTLSPYRQHGLATHLLAAVTRAAATVHGVAVVYAHVWVANDAGLAWYRARGFAVLRREEGYYRRLRPSGAWVVWRRVGVADMLAGGGGGVEVDAGVPEVGGGGGGGGGSVGGRGGA